MVAAQLQNGQHMAGRPRQHSKSRLNTLDAVSKSRRRDLRALRPQVYAGKPTYHLASTDSHSAVNAPMIPRPTASTREARIPLWLLVMSAMHCRAAFTNHRIGHKIKYWRRSSSAAKAKAAMGAGLSTR